MLEKPPERVTIITMDWKDTVKDQDEIKVFLALDGPSYTWRTASGIARQAGLPEQRVWEILQKYNMALIRISDLPSASGSALVGLLEKVG
jgi:hypothetical protein